jgi:hypothetical protein
MIFNKSKKTYIYTVFLCMMVAPSIFGQTEGESQRAIITAVPFLRIAPDARSSAMGDAGIAVSPDANSLYFNTSNLAFAEADMGVSLTYSSWLKSLGLNDVFLAYISAYKKIGDNQAVGFGLRFFSIGQMQYTDEQGNALQTVKPYELAADLAYARKLGKNFSLGLTIRYIMSSLGTGSTSVGATLKPAHAFAADLSFTYRKALKIAKKKAVFSTGLVFSNLGTKISYTDLGEKDYLPANLGVGCAFELYVDKRNSITVAFDLNKMLVPTPPSQQIEDANGNYITNPVYDADSDGIPDYKQQSMPASLFSSIGDAPNGAGEEFRELMVSIGLEYWYNKQFAIRCGYYYENKNKGNRQFFSVGLGVKYKIFNFNFSYLVPTTKEQRNPLDNTLRFSLLFNFGTPKQSEK